MEVFRPELAVFIIAVVGICKALKEMGIKGRMAYKSLFLSLVAGFFSELSGILARDHLAIQNAVVTAFLTYGGATMSYEILLKRFELKKDSPENKIRGD
jgi:hypothetical protein